MSIDPLHIPGPYPERAEVCEVAIRREFLRETVVRDVQTNCISAGQKAPHRRTIVARLEGIDLQKRARRRGEQKVLKATTAVPGSFGASRPLKVVQIDHTKADVFVVDEEARQPIGRPWLTLAMDVCSRMVTGFYLTMDTPSRLSTSVCLLQSEFDKSAWLREREISIRRAGPQRYPLTAVETNYERFVRAVRQGETLEPLLRSFVGGPPAFR